MNKKGFISFEWVIIGSLIVIFAIFMLWQAFPNMFSEAVDKTTNETLEFDQTPFENPTGDKYTPAED